VAELVHVFCPHVVSAEIRAVVHGLLRDAYEYASAVFERRAALGWADGFKSPADVCTRDEDLLATASGDLASMTREIQWVQSGNRYSRERVVRMVPTDAPECIYLFTTDEGMRVELRRHSESSQVRSHSLCDDRTWTSRRPSTSFCYNSSSWDGRSSHAGQSPTIPGALPQIHWTAPQIDPWGQRRHGSRLVAQFTAD
jgi:hypothetical protein